MRQLTSIVPAISLALAFTSATAAARTESKPNQIKFEYVKPKNPGHQPIYDQLKQGRALEHLQELMSPLRLPYPLLYKVAGCDGTKNAFYDKEVVVVCYELLENFLKNAPAQDLPIGISRADTIIGPTFDTFLHETGHAVFDMLQIPVLGREEDAADQFSAFIMLKLDKDEARRMILGSAYMYKLYMPGPQVTVPIKAFSDEHSVPAQRMFNILCLAYGADQKLFTDVVDKGFLPKERAESCAIEYDDIAFALTKLIGPHIDKRLAKDFHKVWARGASARRARLSGR
jgi:hypothetical protein